MPDIAIVAPHTTITVKPDIVVLGINHQSSGNYGLSEGAVGAVEDSPIALIDFVDCGIGGYPDCVICILYDILYDRSVQDGITGVKTGPVIAVIMKQSMSACHPDIVVGAHKDAVYILPDRGA